MTTTDLARRVGISQAQISRLENGLQGFRSGTLLRIAKALGKPPFYFMMNDKQWEEYERGRRQHAQLGVLETSIGKGAGKQLHVADGRGGFGHGKKTLSLS